MAKQTTTAAAAPRKGPVYAVGKARGVVRVLDRGPMVLKRGAEPVEGVFVEVVEDIRDGDELLIAAGNRLWTPATSVKGVR